MAEKIASHMLINGLIRCVEADGGFAAVLRKGDNISGTILIQTVQNGTDPKLFERIRDISGKFVLGQIATKYSGSSEELRLYIDRRCQSDPDLWVLELDVANAERLAADFLTGC